MIRLKTVLGIARAEARLTRRLVRYWIFLVIALLVGTALCAYYGLLHHLFSAYSGTVGLINPRYLVAAQGAWFMMLLTVGIFFLAFDIRSRDSRERMQEVLDSRPYSNLELVLGKALGIFLPTWIGAIVLAGMLLGVGAIYGFLPGRIDGEWVQPLSLISFLTVLVIPAIVFLLGLTILVSLLVRHRGASAVLLLVLLGGLIAGSIFVPVAAGPALDYLGSTFLGLPSDLVPSFVGGLEGWMHRGAFLIIGLGLLFAAAAVHPRKDDSSRSRLAVTGAVLILGGALAVGGIVMSRYGQLHRIEEWRAAHEARQEEPAPDVVSIRGDVRVDPGSRLELDLDIEFRAPSDESLSIAVFSLNPGVEVESVSQDGSALEFLHENGILEVALRDPLETGDSTTVSLRAAGRPDLNFAYLDGALNPLAVSARDQAVFLLGYENSLFRRSYVALLPGSMWLPASGVAVRRGDPTVRPVDFFTADLTVNLPEGWTAALTGRREDRPSEDGRAVQRFAPPAAVPEIALVAARFVARATDVGGVRAEILLHPDHAGQLEVFSEAGDKIRAWVEERLDEAAEVGLTYPYDAITAVEVPLTLRAFAGGWRLDTTLGPPSLVLLRESGFPTSNFAWHFRNPDDFEDREGGIAQAKLDYLLRFFENDFSGGNPFTGSARNFFTYQTAGEGDYGLPLDFVFDDLSRLLLTRQNAYFSAHVFDRDMQASIGQVMTDFFGRTQGQGNFAQSMVRVMTSRTSVWDAALRVPLLKLDPWREPRVALDVLTLKGNAMARSMLDQLGRDKVGSFLTTLRDRRAGANYTREDVIEAGRAVGEDLDPWLDNWIEQTELPGFRVPEADLYRIEDGEDGSPRYQILATVANGESVPGMVKIEYRTGLGPDAESGSSDPVSVPGGEARQIGLLASKAPGSVSVVPYLSLNRQPFDVPLPSVDEENIRKEEPLRGARAVDWSLPDTPDVIVDDLDEGFAAEDEAGGKGFRFSARTSDDEETDQGLPLYVLGERPRRWSRMTFSEAWGRYRHTLAVIRAGDGERAAVFTTSEPGPGSWDLALYLPDRNTPGIRFLGRSTAWKIVVDTGDEEREIPFDAAAAESGWNYLGTFELDGGEVRVRLTDAAESGMVVADAIRWSPANGGS